jgi:hypothetical protein
MWSKWVTGLVLVVVAVMFVASGAMAAKMLCVSDQDLKGQETVASCLARGERFAVVDDYGIVHIMTPQEVALTRAFNPKALETQAFGMKYQKEAPITPMRQTGDDLP